MSPIHTSTLSARRAVAAQRVIAARRGAARVEANDGGDVGGVWVVKMRETRQGGVGSVAVLHGWCGRRERGGGRAGMDETMEEPRLVVILSVMRRERERERMRPKRAWSMLESVGGSGLVTGTEARQRMVRNGGEALGALPSGGGREGMGCDAGSGGEVETADSCAVSEGKLGQQCPSPLRGSALTSASVQRHDPGRPAHRGHHGRHGSHRARRRRRRACRRGRWAWAARPSSASPRR